MKELVSYSPQTSNQNANQVEILKMNKKTICLYTTT